MSALQWRALIEQCIRFDMSTDVLYSPGLCNGNLDFSFFNRCFIFVPYHSTTDNSKQTTTISSHINRTHTHTPQCRCLSKMCHSSSECASMVLDSALTAPCSFHRVEVEGLLGPSVGNTALRTWPKEQSTCFSSLLRLEICPKSVLHY